MRKSNQIEQQPDLDRIKSEIYATTHKRGKVLPGAKAAWGAVTGDGGQHDPNDGHAVLREALGSCGD